MKGKYLDAVLTAGQEARSAVLATEIASGAQLYLDDNGFDGELQLDDAGRENMRAALRSGRTTTVETAGGMVMIEAFAPARRCFVIGAVHIAQPLVPMLIATDYKPIVIDPRGAWATEARFPGVEISTDWPDEAMERLKPDRATAVVALTHDPKIDDPALISALRSDCFYIGALGSRRTHAKRLERFAAEGFGENELSRIHGPIGLNIGAISQAEIAVSIVGQITEILHRGDR
jgi:xanthine dehydrogenase accessory factor